MGIIRRFGITASLVAVLLLVLPLSACSGSPALPSGTIPASTVQAPDDIVFTPGGGMYRANVNQEGQTNPWPRVDVAVTDWTTGSDTISVMYRPEIVSKAGESHPDIILVSPESDSFTTNTTLELYAAKLPSGITLADTHMSVAMPGTVGTVVVVTAAPGMAVGSYSVKIGIRLNGRDYGAVPCSVNITSPG